MRGHRSVRVAALAVILTLAGAACGDDADGDRAAAGGEVGAGDAYEAPGPHPVGHATVTLTDTERDDRSLTVDLWYPTTPEGAAGRAPAAYPLLGGVELVSEEARDGAPLAGGPWPVVLYSHGFAGQRFVSSFLTEHLASHGFVVVAPDHAGNTTLDVFTGRASPASENEADRPRDLSFVIDSLLAGDADPAVAGLADQADPARIGVIGHSFGGYTALAIVAGADAVTPDRRVRAIVPLAPYTEPLSDADLGRVTVPFLVVSGTDDSTTPIADHTTRVWSQAPARPAYRVDIEGASHQSFTDICDYVTLVEEQPAVPALLAGALEQFASGTCDGDAIDIDLAHDLIERYATEFLLAHVAGDGEALAVLGDDLRDPRPEVTASLRAG